MRMLKTRPTLEIVNYTEIESRKEELRKYSAAKNTQASYKSAIRLFCQFAINKKIPSDTKIDFVNLCVKVAKPEMIENYVIHLSDKRKINTIKHAVAAIGRTWKEYQAEHKIIGGVNPIHAENVRIAIGRVKREQVDKAHRKGVVLVTQAKGITKQDLERVMSQIDRSTLKGKRDALIIILGFKGGFRRSELADLKVSNLVLQKDGDYVIELTKSKTDQLGEGKTKHIPYASDYNLCPVRAISEWLEASKVKGYLLAQMNRRSGNIVQDSRVSSNLIYRVIKMKFGKEYSAHSLRVGFVQSASEAGATITEIIKQTGHKGTSMVAHYTKHSNVKKNNAVGKLGF